MAALDVNAAGGLLKTYFKGPMRENINQGTQLTGLFDKRDDMVQGLEVKIPIRLERSEGVGARSVKGSVPLATARPSVVDQATVDTVFLTGQIEVTIPSIQKLRNSEGGFMGAVESESKSMTATLKEDLERMVADNDAVGTGSLGIAVNASSSTTINITGADLSSPVSIRKGMYVDLVDDDDDSVFATGLRITQVNLTSGVVTSIVVDSAVDASGATGDYHIVRVGNWKNEVIGLPGIISSTGVLHGLDQGDYDEWASTVTAVGGALSEDDLQKLFHDVDIKSGAGVQGNPSYHLGMRYEQLRRIHGLLEDKVRYNVTKTPGINGGFETIHYNNAPIIISRFLDPTEIYLMHKDHLMFQSESDWDFIDDDGSVLHRVAGFAHYESTLYKMTQFVTDDRGAHGKLTGLTI